jgi:hypothetical protein
MIRIEADQRVDVARCSFPSVPLVREGASPCIGEPGSINLELRDRPHRAHAISPGDGGPADGIGRYRFKVMSLE